MHSVVEARRWAMSLGEASFLHVTDLSLAKRQPLAFAAISQSKFHEMPMPDDRQLDPDLSFEQALSRLERIVASLERGESDLSHALASYETGVALLTHCHQILDKAEHSVALLTGVDDVGNPLTAPFDGTTTIQRESASASVDGLVVTPRVARKRKSPERSTPPMGMTSTENESVPGSDPPF